jgi:hypothetical protein
MIKIGSSVHKIELGGWVDHFSNLFHRDMGVVPLRETRIMGPLYMEELDSDFTMKEITEGMKRMKNKKAPGVNGIPLEMWREFSNRNDGCEVTMNLINGIKNGKVVPRLWKAAKLCPAYKGKGR